MHTYSVLRQVTRTLPDGSAAISWDFIAALPALTAAAALEKAKRIHKPSRLLAVKPTRVH